MRSQLRQDGLSLTFEDVDGRCYLRISEQGWGGDVCLAAGYVNLIAVTGGVKYYLANSDAEVTLERQEEMVILECSFRGGPARRSEIRLADYREIVDSLCKTNAYMA